MVNKDGRVPSEPGSREPSPDGLGPTGFDPSRGDGWEAAKAALAAMAIVGVILGLFFGGMWVFVALLGKAGFVLFWLVFIFAIFWICAMLDQVRPRK